MSNFAAQEGGYAGGIGGGTGSSGLMLGGGAGGRWGGFQVPVIFKRLWRFGQMVCASAAVLTYEEDGG
jgi:hypothetical protein